MATSSKINPGVGNYDLRDNAGKEAVKYSFGKEMRSQSARPKTPGPGSYQAKNFIGNDGPKITISSVRPLTSMGSTGNLAPGPGAYNSNLNDRLKAPSYGFGSSKRNQGNKEAERVPGAGSYNPGERGKSPTWSIGKSQRGNKNTNEFVPGPGNYEYMNSLGNGPKVNKYFNWSFFITYSSQWKENMKNIEEIWFQDQVNIITTLKDIYTKTLLGGKNNFP